MGVIVCPHCKSNVDTTRAVVVNTGEHTCPYCANFFSIPAPQMIAPKAQTLRRVTASQRQMKNAAMGWIVLTAVIVVGAIGIGVVAMSQNGKDDKPKDDDPEVVEDTPATPPPATVQPQPPLPPPTPAIDRHSESSYNAYEAAQEFIKHRLKSPSTAVFPRASDVRITKQDDAWSINGYYDAQNSFGAMLRGEYVCRVKYLGAGEWEEVDFLSLD